ncbi:HlyD family efflux transporter periplasmic adaptor subunit [Roseateles albus]|uniref:Uncharacterized protein n=1 Tax=Roseateles albus TaxID=2987525 RepID=A0ABT5K859_9BURK|nr:HlyD family efflux transporter periplasmic adaptor subunit [Roseateles albus]MDC8770135.1 hypothetical protein [Roseateles albus]
MHFFIVHRNALGHQFIDSCQTGHRVGLAVVRKAASGLSARAPRDGQLSGFTLQVGSSVKPGDRLGRIDNIASFKLSGNVDEFYLSRVQTGLQASLEAGARPPSAARCGCAGAPPAASRY